MYFALKTPSLLFFLSPSVSVLFLSASVYILNLFITHLSKKPLQKQVQNQKQLSDKCKVLQFSQVYP